MAADSCEDGECQPVPGNLIIGRADSLKASSEKSDHPASKLVTAGASPDAYFESEDGVEDVTLTLGLEQAMQLSSVRIEFAGAEDVPLGITFSRSNDHGNRFRPFHYVARDCSDTFGMDSGPRTAIKDVACETQNGSRSAVEFVVVPPAHQSPPDERYFFAKVTNLSIKFSGLNTRSSRRSFRVTRLVIAGSCLCYGHAARCQQLEGGKVSPVCECQHNTNATNCDSCLDSFNDRRWAPASGRDKNECAPCNCSGQADSCFFDQSVYEASGERRSGGVCLGCRNSIGNSCQTCRSFYYRDGNSCKACACSPTGSLTRLCDQTTGQCDCQSGFQGRDCGSSNA